MQDTTSHDTDAIRSLASSLGYYLDSIGGLRQHRAQASGQIFVRGYYRAGDGGEGYFLWDSTSTLKDDGGTAIDPSDGGGVGRWVRMTRGAYVTPLWWGAKFDDATDDTEAIQAAIDFAVTTGGNVLLPPGTAKITRTLVLTTGGHGNHSGFRFSGRGKFGNSGSSIREGSGTLLKFYGAADSANAILNIDKSLWRYTTVSDLSLICVTPFACKFGLLFSSTEFSQHTIENITVENVKVAFGILGGSGANGEFTYFANCGASGVGIFFYSNSGQAFVQRFEHCTCGLLPGGTYFALDIIAGKSPGGGLVVTDFNATGGNSGDAFPPTNTTLLHTGESMSPISFFGGRIEHLTRLLDLSPNFLGLPISIRGMDITVDCDIALKGNTVGPFIKVHNNAAMVSISDCQFEAIKHKETLAIDVSACADYGPQFEFSNCAFYGFLAAPRIFGLRHDTMSSVKFRDCRISMAFAKPIRGGQFTDPRKQPMNLEWGAIEAREAVRSRSLSSANALAVSGRPSNLLAAPAICSFDRAIGPSVAPDRPWSSIGMPGDIRIARADQAGEPLRNGSAWARTILIQPGAGFFQDISGIDLSADAGTTHYFGTPIHELFYQALLPSISGAGSLRIAIENSITGEVYDESVLRAVVRQTSGPHLVSLLARVPPLAQSSRFRLKLQNIGTTDSVVLAIAWQYASPKMDASFVGIDGLTEMADDWAVSTESLRAWSRFMLPYKPDSFGATAVQPLKDLYSDQYLSADDGRLTYFAGDVWCKAPRTTYDVGPPAHGSWRVGDQVLNRQPKSGAYIGWVCTVAGAPGDWRPFGLIG